MYTTHFGLKENPFSISPDPRYLYMSQRHKEALAHLLYGTQQAGGFIQLTGEVGTGKTTLTRALLQQLPDNVDVALLLNPKQTAVEFLQSICDELRIPYDGSLSSIKTFVDALNDYLLLAHKKGRHTVLLIDEAQNLTVDVLEQIRLLTNLETTQKKLLQIILVGQPELRVLLARKDLRQLAQRITARYHLLPLTESETREFIMHRLSVAGQNKMIFNKSAIRVIQSISKGIPRLINIICDRALLGAYSQGRHYIDAKIIKRAAQEVTGEASVAEDSGGGQWYKPAIAASLVLLTASSLFFVSSGPVDSFTFRASNTIDITPQNPEAGMQDNAKAEQPPVVDNTAVLTNLAASTDEASLLQEAGMVELIGSLQAEKTRKAEVADRPVDVAALPDLDALLKQGNLKSDSGTAYAQLFSLWSRDYTNVAGATACEKAQTQGLSCWHNKGTWNNLRLVNRPAVIELIDSDKQSHSVVVSTLDGNMVSLNFGGQEFNLPITEVDPYWYGNFVVLWKQPPVELDTIHPGIRGSAALWLKLTLNKVDGIESQDEIDNLFDNELVQRVKAFQRERYLQDDGVVGKQTMIHLNTALNDPTIPMLRRNLVANSTQQSSQPFKVIQ